MHKRNYTLTMKLFRYTDTIATTEVSAVYILLLVTYSDKMEELRSYIEEGKQLQDKTEGGIQAGEKQNPETVACTKGVQK